MSWKRKSDGVWFGKMDGAAVYLYPNRLSVYIGDMWFEVPGFFTREEIEKAFS